MVRYVVVVVIIIEQGFGFGWWLIVVLFGHGNY
jgi:hypothetical protein